MRLSSQLQIGKAGEYLTCADLIMKGFVAFPSEQGLPYDVLLDDGKRLLRVQVKTCEKPRIVPQRAAESTAYIFNIKRHGKNNAARYEADEVDIFALVCLDTKEIGYLTPRDMPDTVNFRVDALRGSYYDEKGIQDFEKVIELKEQMTQTEIAKTLEMQISTVNRMCKPDYVPFKTSARYFSDIVRCAEWFKEI